ncbi:MAG: 2-C-methyl-D-erythritol 4-phosphate cytidylyltransferase, partial [Phycisphaerales bacterium]|nr:2-C-methyl-D-erythritol 4-phosphate cytidylyltransferase [Phycisphaerales bacterium]
MGESFRVEVIVPAAGRSTRFGGGSVSGPSVGASKLDQDLGGRTVLLRTIEALSRRDEITRIVVAAPPEDFDAFRDRYGATLGFHGVQIVAGGVIDRWESVRNALAAISDDATHIAVHDAARPGVGEALLDRLFAAAREYDAVIPGL